MKNENGMYAIKNCIFFPFLFQPHNDVFLPSRKLALRVVVILFQTLLLFIFTAGRFYAETFLFCVRGKK
jgi:hypothetical protein